MSIAKLRQIARQRLPYNVSDDDEVDELRVLMAAGLITGLSLKVPPVPHGRGDDRYCPVASRVIRVLAITSEGRRLLRRSDADEGQGRDRSHGDGDGEGGLEGRTTSH